LLSASVTPSSGLPVAALMSKAIVHQFLGFVNVTGSGHKFAERRP
jgi:hypothetical protein